MRRSWRLANGFLLDWELAVWNFEVDMADEEVDCRVRLVLFTTALRTASQTSLKLTSFCLSKGDMTGTRFVGNEDVSAATFRSSIEILLSLHSLLREAPTLSM